MPVTVGIARTRTLAKLISDSAKPFGALAVLDRAGRGGAAGRPAGDRDHRHRRPAGGAARALGHRTCLDLARADRRLVRELLTATGEALWWELNGDPVQPIHPQRPLHKALSRGGSFGEATAEPVVLYAWLVRNLERLIEELEFHAVLAGRLTVWVAYKNGPVGRRPDDAGGAQRPVRRPARRRPALPAPGVDAARRGDADAPDRRASHAPRPGAARPVRPARRRARPRPSPGSSARSTPATAGSPSAPSP